MNKLIDALINRQMDKAMHIQPSIKLKLYLNIASNVYISPAKHEASITAKNIAKKKS